MIRLEDVQRGYDAWAAKPHNAKWVRKIDGTPVPNDIVVNIFEALKEVKLHWRCFHCNDVFTDEQAARSHFGTGDHLILHFFDPLESSTGTPALLGAGSVLSRRVTFVLPGGQFGIEHGYCVLGLADSGDVPGGAL